MSTLFDYLQQTQRFIRDQRQQEVDPGDLINYINQARREVAMRSQSIRRLPPISGQITTASVINPGVGYSSLSTVSITPPDFPSGQLPNPNGAQASASCVIVGGQVQSVVVPFGGDGYFKPIATIVDPTNSGSNASVSLQLSPIATIVQGQEVYPFSWFDLSVFPGVGSIYMIRSISIIFSNWRYSLPIYSFSTYQSRCRQYAAGAYQYVPAIASVYGRGTAGSLYLYPLPSATYQIEVDSICLPQDLVTDQSVEVIPEPWQDAVPYWAAALGFDEMLNFNAAREKRAQFDERMKYYSQAAQTGYRVNPYGRWAFWLTLLPLAASAMGWA